MMFVMARTTVTLTDAAEAVVRRLIGQRGTSFKETVDIAILVGARPSEEVKPFTQRPVAPVEPLGLTITVRPSESW